MATPIEKVDVLICGGGSAGLTAAIWLARFGINFKVLESRSGPLKIGQADGVQCRTVEIFESLGIADPLLKLAYHVMELALWSSDKDGRIARNNVAPDTEPGITHQPHVILNQGRINDIMINEIKRLSGFSDAGIKYNCRVQGIKILDSAPGEPYPVEVDVEQDGTSRIYKAKYAIGSDGAHSTVRKSLGFNMVGDSTDAVWGVMDIYPFTNFPDIRKKSVLNSKNGNLLIIPREGDEMVRMYIELPAGTVASEVAKEYLQKRAQTIFHPYELEIAHTLWWSAYSIGQRQADHFTKDLRVFLTGDACHTHSPKAGQGMNVSLQDGYNIGWKLGYLLNGWAPADILETYISEREETARDLIDFDRHFTKLFNTKYRQEHGITSEDFKDQFLKAGRYTAGLATKYCESILTRVQRNDKKLASKLDAGMRFPSHPVVRFSDARPLQLAQALPSDGRWHVVVFAGDRLTGGPSTELNQFASQLDKVIRVYTPAGTTRDSLVNCVLVISSERLSVAQEHVPDLFNPPRGEFGVKCLQKVFVDGESYYDARCGRCYESYGIDQADGALVIVRPDLYISAVTPMGDSNAVGDFFDRCMVRVSR